MDPIAAFPTLLNVLGLKRLESDASVIYGLTADLRLAYMNPAWYRFAEANDGEPTISRRFPIGTPLIDAISGPLKQYYVDHFSQVLGQTRPRTHDYECSSADVYRKFHQTIYPLDDRHGLLVVNALTVERPHADEMTVAGIEADYRDADGLMVQCGHCRRFRRLGDAQPWDWVPAFVSRRPTRVSQGLCPICLAYYYPGFGR